MSELEQDKEKLVDLSAIRWKMLVACDICRRRKVRCDGQRPCSRCSKGNKKCTFSTPRRVFMHPEGASTPKRRGKSPHRPTDGESPKRSRTSSPERRDSAGPSTAPSVTGESSLSSPPDVRPEPGKEHLLLIDPDDQIVYSGPSTGMPLFARLGLLHTVEVSESDKTAATFASHSAGALGLSGAYTSSSDFFDLCVQCCPQELMFSLIGYHLSTPIFFPLLHAPSFLSEFVAVTQRRLTCTAQYGALLMSILAVTARLVEKAKVLLPVSEQDQPGEAYYELAQDFLRISKNKLDIRHILALYHLALFAEGRNSSTGSVSSFVAEAVGLAFTTGLHRSTREFEMDPVTGQIRTRLFWALYTLDTALAYSQGRPPLMRLSECSIDLPVIVDNEYITKTEILPQPDDRPPIAIAAAVKMIEIYMVSEQVLSAINAPPRTAAAAFSLDNPPLQRKDLLKRALTRLSLLERDIPPYLRQVDPTPNPAADFFHSCRVLATFKFVRTLIARQALIDEYEASPMSSTDVAGSATAEACRLSVDTIRIYSRLRHLGLLQFCGFQAVSHITAAAHTLIACMRRSANIAFEHRPDLLTAVDVLLVFASSFPYVKTVVQLLGQLSRTLDYSHGSNSQSEAVAIRILARRMARSSTSDEHSPSAPDFFSWSSSKCDSNQKNNADPLFGNITNSEPFNGPITYQQLPTVDNDLPLETSTNATAFNVTYWLSSQSATSVEPQMIPNVLHDTSGKATMAWEDTFSFLNDGLFNSL